MNILNKLTELEDQAAQFGFKWETPEQIMAQIHSECSEIDVNLKDHDKEKLQEEIGDLLHAVFSLCVFCKFSPEETLQKSVKKFERRFRAVKEIAYKQGLNTLDGLEFDELMRLWDEAKVKVG